MSALPPSGSPPRVAAAPTLPDPSSAIGAALAPLVGLAVWGPRRESNLLTLELGERRSAPTRGEPGREQGERALHVYCAWRVTRGTSILAGSGDLFTPADPDEDLDDFDYDEPGASWWDVRVAAWLPPDREPPRVTAVSGDPVGGARLALSDGSTLELFPQSSPADHVESEFWRLVDRTPGGAPFAMTSLGVDRTLPS